MADEVPERLRSLSPLGLYILLHLRRANVDYAASIARMSEVPLERVLEELDRLESAGLVERRVGGTSIKRSEARFKLSDEVTKHHVYYQLSRAGEMLARSVRGNRDLLEKYFDYLAGHPNVLRLLEFLDEAENEHAGTLAKVVGDTPCRTVDLLDRLVDLGLVARVKAKVLKASHRKAKPKPETRTHHVYYRLSRLAELILRFSEIRRRQ